MIDEKKMKRDLQKVIATCEDNSPQKRLLQGILQYISMQRVFTVREVRFFWRMERYVKLVGGKE